MRTKKNTGLNLKNEYSEGKTLVPHRKTNQEKAILDSSDSKPIKEVDPIGWTLDRVC